MPLGEQDKLRLDCFLSRIRKDSDSFLGYPSSKDFDFSIFKDFLHYPINNIGDPFIDGSYKVNSKEFEREVLREIATMLRAPEDNWWGYVTNGGTEGNLYSLYLARELHPNAMVYFSQASHYSVVKNLHFLNMRHIMIRAQENGEVDYDDLAETINIHRDVPAIIFANIGTTMTEAKDDIKKIQSILDDYAIVNRYIHCDAALSGAIAPFLTPRPAFDFADGADSIAISGHKFIGSPIPCGIVLAKKLAVDRIAQSISYIGTLDTTISGSRNGLTPLFLWHSIRLLGTKGMRARVSKSLEVAAYATERLNQIGVAAWRNENAITVVFPAPSVALQEKWQLATEGDRSHIVAMPGIGHSDIDRFINDMKTDMGIKCAS
ncbi:MAG: histidine decarboxylase [Proteobacteria bacterium]|nr:histidine decarboxylase [Pseudomonadota bacterium]